MISFFKKLKASKLKAISYQLNRGMTYVELIVILSIFSTLSAVVVFNYAAFQDRIDLKNLTSDIALKVVEAQKSSVSGRQPPKPVNNLTWRSSYGIYLNRSDDKRFIYFADIITSLPGEQDGLLNDPSNCDSSSEECLEQIFITKGSAIDSLDAFSQGNETPQNLSDLTVSFIRPSGAAIIKSSTSLPANVSYVQISVISPRGFTAAIKIFPSGRIELD